MSSSDQAVMTLLLANLNNNNYINSTGNTIITNKLADYAYSTVAPTPPTTSGFQNQKEGCVNNYASIANENGSLVDWHNKLSGSSFSPLV